MHLVPLYGFWVESAKYIMFMEIRISTLFIEVIIKFTIHLCLIRSLQIDIILIMF